MLVVRQADDPFVCFGAKPDKGFWLEISDETESGVGKAGPREDREKLAKGDAEGQSTTDSRRDQSAWDRVQGPESTTVSSEEDGQRGVGIPSSL